MDTPATAKHRNLSEVQLLAGLSDAELRQVEEGTSMSRCERGRVFFAPEDSPGSIWFLKEGRVRLYRRTTDGKQLTVAMLDRGAVLGESALLGQSHAGVYAEADEDCLLCVMPVERLRALVVSVPRIGLNLLEHVGQQLKRSQELAEEVAYWSVKRRLAKALLDLDDRYGHPTMGNGRVINRHITQAQIAELIGSTRETVAELLGTLRRQDVIAARGRRIIIRDSDALREWVERGERYREVQRAS
jgi:CRP/FNR family transcriptional regulator, cyclic AMP receptor protein